MKHHVFLSYSEADQAQAERVRAGFVKQGISAWDGTTGAAGVLAQQDIYEQALREAGCAVVILSPAARGSRWVREQTDFARKQGLPILLILLGGNKGDSTPPALNDLPWIDATRDFEAALEELAAAVYGRLNLEGSFKRQLHFWNPLDQFRLLYWLFFTPGRYLSYKAFAGEKAARIVGSWLVSLLTWLPLFLATLGFALTTGSGQTGIVFGGVLLMGWLLDSLLGPANNEAAGVMGSVGTFFISIMLTFALTSGDWLGSVALVTASIAAAGVAHVLAGDVARFVALGVAIGTTVGAASAQANVVIGGILVGVAFAAGILLAYLLTMRVIKVLQTTVQQRRPTFASHVILALWAISYVLLIAAFW